MVNVEKVVKAPKNPVIIKGLHGRVAINYFLVAAVISPMRRQPTKLGSKTSRGN
jgi:hypothetical protein